MGLRGYLTKDRIYYEAVSPLSAGDIEVVRKPDGDLPLFYDGGAWVRGKRGSDRVACEVCEGGAGSSQSGGKGMMSATWTVKELLALVLSAIGVLATPIGVYVQMTSRLVALEKQASQVQVDLNNLQTVQRSMSANLETLQRESSRGVEVRGRR